MNDLQELRFGMSRGSMMLRVSNLLFDAAGTEPRSWAS
jgi:hypothetical protein